MEKCPKHSKEALICHQIQKEEITTLAILDPNLRKV